MTAGYDFSMGGVQVAYWYDNNPKYQEDDIDVIEEHIIHNQYRLSEEDTQKGILIDIGANIGAVSAWWSACGNHGVAAYEPDERNLRFLRKNLLRLNDYTDSAVYEEAVVGIAGTYEVVGQGSSARLEPSEYGDIVGVTLRTVFEREGATPISVLKMDIEGGEYDIFTSLTDDFFAEHQPLRIVMEFHKKYGYTVDDIVKKICPWYEVEMVGHRIYGGMLYATRKSEK